MSRQDDQQKQTQGNILLYDYLATRRVPVFLKRNLRRALEADQPDRHPSTPPVPTINPRSGFMFPPPKKMYLWNRKWMLNVFAQAVKPWSEHGKPGLSLNQPRTRLPERIPCSVDLKIFDATYGVVLASPSRSGHLVQRTTKTTDKNVFILDVPESFREPIGDLVTSGQISPNAKMSAQITIRLRNQEDAKIFLSYAFPDLSIDPQELLCTRFTAQWTGLPEFPKDGHLLKFVMTNGDKQGDSIELGLQVQMSWSKPKAPSVMASFNQERLAQYRAVAQQAPAPDPKEYHVQWEYIAISGPQHNTTNTSGTRRWFMESKEQEDLSCRHCPTTFLTVGDLLNHLKIRHKIFQYRSDFQGNEQTHVKISSNCGVFISYNYPDASRKLVLDDLRCPHCPRVIATDLDELKLHLRYFHPRFEYHAATKTQRGGHGGVTTTSVRFEAKISRCPEEDERVLRKRAPKRAFEVVPTLDAEDRTYVREPVGARQAKENGLTTEAGCPSPGLRPEDVQPLPPAAPRKFIVPRSKRGITLYATASKRPLVPGEEVCESDDEADTFYLKLKQNAYVDYRSAHLPPGTRMLMKVWSDWLTDVRLHGDVFVGANVVRFARWCEQTGRTQDPVFVDELVCKASQLLSDQFISPEIHEFVWNLRLKQQQGGASREDKEEGSEPRVKRARLHEGRHQSREWGGGRAKASYAAKHAVEDVAPYGLCVCGTSTESAYHCRPVIYCKNHSCVRGAFHLDCVSGSKASGKVLDPRRNEWLCAACSG